MAETLNIFSLDVEVWQPIADFEGYRVSSWGRVKSVRCRGSCRKGKVLSQNESNRYLKVNLYQKGVRHTMKIHWLVAGAFIPPVKGKEWVNHKDLYRHNNFVGNLEWVTPEENTAHYVQAYYEEKYYLERAKEEMEARQLHNPNSNSNV